MDVLQCVALIAGAAAAICLAVPWKHRLILSIVFTIVALLFQIATLWFHGVNPPHLDYSIKLLDSNYMPGVDVDGIRWKKSFRRYMFKLNSKQGAAEANDVRLSFVLPTGVVGYRLLSHAGCENLSFPERETSVYRIARSGSMMGKIHFYQNLFDVATSKILSGGKIIINLILIYQEGCDDRTYGILATEYKYKDENNKDVKEEHRFPIFIDKKTKELKIDMSKSAGPEHKFFHVMIPKHPIKVPFGHGEGVKFHMLPSGIKDKE
jgi:hypothetical protein